MIRISKIMLNKLSTGKYLKLEDVYLYGLLANKANYSERHTIVGLTLNWFCTCMGADQTDKSRRTIKSRLERIESLGLIKIGRNYSPGKWEPYYYEVIQPTKEYELVNTDFFYLKGVSPAAKGLALLLSVFAFRGNNSINYSDKELAKRCHISLNTFKKYKAELIDSGLLNGSILSATFFPIIVNNKPLKDKIAELRLFTGSQRMQKQLDWFESIFLEKEPSNALNEFGLKVLFKIESGLLNQNKVEKELERIML